MSLRVPKGGYHCWYRIGGIWRYLSVFGGIWRYLAVFGGIWRYLAVFGGIGRYWAVLGGIGRYWAVLGGIGRYWAVLGGIGRYWAVLGGICGTNSNYPPSLRIHTSLRLRITLVTLVCSRRVLSSAPQEVPGYYY